MKTKIISIVLVLTLMFSISGCGKSDSNATVESVIKEMSKASNDVKGTAGTADIDFVATMDAGGGSYDISISGTMDMKSNTDPVMSYMNMDLSVNMAGFTQPMKYELYTEQKDDTVTTYINYNNEWNKSTSDLDDQTKEMMNNLSDVSKYITQENIDKYFSDVKLDEKSDKYIVSGSLTKDSLKTIVKELSGVIGKDFATDSIPEMKIPIKITIDKSTNLPAEMTMSLNMDEYQGLKISKADITMKYDSYEAEQITIPDEALNASEESVNDIIK